MGSSNQYTIKVIIIFCLAFFFSRPPKSSADTLPDANDISRPAKEAKLTFDTFMRESFELRLQFEYSGKFLTEADREKLQVLAKRASDKLPAITESQKNLKARIEDYEGDDWDERYGSTGLWRKLFAELYATNLKKCEIDFYIARCAGKPNRDEVLHGILAQLDSLSKTHDTAYLRFLQARAFALLARTNPAYKSLAQKEFDALSVRSDMRHSTVFGIAIERIKLLGPAEPGRLEKLTDELAQSSSGSELELVLSLACLQRRLNQPKAFEKTVRTWPQIENILGSLALSDMSYKLERGQLDFESTSLLEAQLAAQAAWKDSPGKYITLLENLAETENFQTPLILYVTAAASADSSPAKTAGLLIKASNLQQARPSSRLDIEAGEIAEQAARLAYNLFVQKDSYCRLVLEAFENYSAKAGEKIDEKLEYLYSIVLIKCGQRKKGKELLQKIAAGPAGAWQSRAQLNLIEQEIEQKQYENDSGPQELLKELSDFIGQCSGRSKESNELRAEAITVYCRALLEAKDKARAKMALDMLTDAEIQNDPNLNVFKAKALRHLGKLDESAQCLREVADRPYRIAIAKYAEAMALLSEIIDKIDQYEANSADFPKMVKDCYNLACYCWDRASGGDSQRVALIVAEITAFNREIEQKKLFAANELITNLAKQGDADQPNSLRCQARLAAAQGKFEQAAKLWAKVAEIRKNQAPSKSTRPRQWWRAKFYELDCLAKMPQRRKGAVLHTIEVLESSFTNVPAFWAEKLNLLKQHCRNDDDNRQRL